MAAVGVSTPRRDSEPKVRGTTRFAADLPVPGVLHARLVLSPEPHARIISIGTGAALAADGVVAVLTAADLPLAARGPGRLYEPLAREEIIYAGQPVAVVLAETEALAEDGVELVELELESLEPVLETGSRRPAGGTAGACHRLGPGRRGRSGRRPRGRLGRGAGRGSLGQRARHGAAG